jgi:hypothetical protein
MRLHTQLQGLGFRVQGWGSGFWVQGVLVVGVGIGVQRRMHARARAHSLSLSLTHSLTHSLSLSHTHTVGDKAAPRAFSKLG